MNNPKFDSLLEEMKKIHDKKNSDYAEDNNPYSNFEFAAYYAQIPVYKVYLVLEAIKTARLHQLHLGKVAKNESINDTYLDKATYAIIEASHLRVLENKVPIKEEEAYGHTIRLCPICQKAIYQSSKITRIGNGTYENPHRDVHTICNELSEFAKLK